MPYGFETRKLTSPPSQSKPPRSYSRPRPVFPAKYRAGLRFSALFRDRELNPGLQQHWSGYVIFWVAPTARSLPINATIGAYTQPSILLVLGIVQTRCMVARTSITPYKDAARLPGTLRREVWLRKPAVGYAVRHGAQDLGRENLKTCCSLLWQSSCRCNSEGVRARAC